MKVFSQRGNTYEPQLFTSGYKHKQEVSHSAILFWPNITFLLLYIESFKKVLLKQTLCQHGEVFEKRLKKLFKEHNSIFSLTYEDALDVDRLNKMAEQGSLVPKHLPLSEFVRGRHADKLWGRMCNGKWEDGEHL